MTKTKRQPLTFDNAELTKDLKQSAGKGMDVFFSPQSPTPTNMQPSRPKVLISPTSAQTHKTAPAVRKTNPSKRKSTKRKKVINIATKQASNIAILHFDDTDIEHLREPAYKAQTYRFADREVEWIKDTAHKLSKEVQRGRVAQVDILRIGIKLFENLLASNKGELIKILDRMK